MNQLYLVTGLGLALVAGACGSSEGEDGSAPEELSFTHHLLDMRGSSLEDLEMDLASGFDSQGRLVLMGHLVVEADGIVDLDATARTGTTLNPELCVGGDPMFPWSSSYDSSPAVLLDSQDRRVSGQRIGRYVAVTRLRYEHRSDWDSSDTIRGSFGFVMLYGTAPAFGERDYPFHVVSAYFDKNTNTHGMKAFRVRAPDAVDDLGYLEGSEPSVAYLASEEALYVAHRTYHDACLIKRHAASSWKSIAPPEVGSDGACRGLAVSGDGKLLAVAEVLNADSTFEVRAFVRDAGQWVDAGQIGAVLPSKLAGIRAVAGGSGIVVMRPGETGAAEFWTSDGGGTWSLMGSVPTPSVVATSFVGGSAEDAFAVYVDPEADSKPHLFRLTSAGIAEDLGTVDAAGNDYAYAAIDPTDGRPVVAYGTYPAEHSPAVKHQSGGFTPLGLLWGAVDAPLRGVTDASGELALFQFTGRCLYIRKETLLFKDTECLGSAIPDEAQDQAYTPLSTHWLALTADDVPVLAVADQSQAGRPTVFRVDDAGSWTNLGGPTGIDLSAQYYGGLQLGLGPGEQPVILTVEEDAAAAVREARLFTHEGGTDWTDQGFQDEPEAREHVLVANEDGVHVAYAYFPTSDGGDWRSMMTVKRLAGGSWSQLGAVEAAGEGASFLRMIGAENGRLYVAYRTNDTPYTWQYGLTSWTGRWHNVGYAADGGLYDRVENPSLVLAPNGKPAIVYISSAEYNFDLWVHLPDD